MWQDVCYLLLNDSFIDWRKLGDSLTMQLIIKAQNNSELNSSSPLCLIIDDTDLPKTGRQIELIGKIFSHETHTASFGVEDFFKGYHESESFFSLDFILHGKKGKNQKKPNGLTLDKPKSVTPKSEISQAKAVSVRTNTF
jgi:hypothetical protein